MIVRRVSFALSFAALAVVAGAQRRSTPSVAHVSPYVGYMAFGSYVDGPFGTSVGNKAAPLYGAQLGIDLTPSIAFIGNVGFSASQLQAGLPIIGGLDLADSKVFVYDAGLQIKLPETATLGIGGAPFVQAGAGAMRTEVSVGSLRSKSTALALNYGAGVDLPIGKSFSMRLMAKDYISKLDLKEATTFDINTKRTHNWGLSVGMNVGF